MWDNGLEGALGTLWEVMAGESAPIAADDLRKKTGLPLPKIYSCLSKMSEVGILEVADHRNNMWQSKKGLDAMAYARAVEIGIPLVSLEKTVALSVSAKKQAEKIAASGEIDREQRQRREQKINTRKTILRGRAATRAATTDLAKIVQDAQEAFANSGDNRFKEEIRAEAVRALEALISALEKK